MRKQRTLILTAAALLAVGCGGPETAEEPAGGPPTEEAMAEAERMIEDTLSRIAREEASTFPCSLFETEEMSELAGFEVESGGYTFEHRSTNERSWRAQVCSWHIAEGGAGHVGVAVSGAQHFDSGEVECWPLGDQGTQELPGLGDRAWWSAGTLRICSGGALVDIQFLPPSGDEAAAQARARRLGQEVLARI